MSFQFDGPEEAGYSEPAFAGDTYVQNNDGFPVPPEPAAYREPAPRAYREPARPASRPRPRSGERGRGQPPARPSRTSLPGTSLPGTSLRRPGTLTPGRVAGILVAVIGLLVIALLVPSIVRSLRTDTVDGTVVAGSGAHPSGRWQVRLVIPEQSQAVVFGARSAEQARVGLPVTISVPAEKISQVSGVITQLTPRTASEGGGFAAVAQIRGTTRVIPSAGMTAEVQLGS